LANPVVTDDTSGIYFLLHALHFFCRLPNPYAVTRYKLLADGWNRALNSLEYMIGENLTALGGGKIMRLMDWSTLFQIGSEK